VLDANEPNTPRIIVVDDGSRDATADAARHARSQAARIKSCRHQKHRGIGAALKSGVRIARGDWVTFLPADGQIEPARRRAARRRQKRTAAPTSRVQRVRRPHDGLDRKLFSLGVRALNLRRARRPHGAATGPYLFRRAPSCRSSCRPTASFSLEFPIRMLAARTPRAASHPMSPAPRRSEQEHAVASHRRVARELVESAHAPDARTCSKLV